MRKQLVKALTTISFLIAVMIVTVGSTQGQSLGNPIKVRIPFDFVVADQKLPVGEYSVGRLPNYSSDSVLMIKNTDGRQVAIRLTNAAETLEPKQSARLVFHRYGDENFLFQVWPAGAQIGRVLVKSRREREAAHKVQDIVRTLPKDAPVVKVLKITVTAQ